MARSQCTVARWSVSHCRLMVGSGRTVSFSVFVADNSVLHNQNNVAASSRTKRRIVVTLVLLFIVATVVPFQFAYVVACVVQFSSCIKALNRTKDVILLASNIANNRFATTDERTNPFKPGHSSTTLIPSSSS